MNQKPSRLYLITVNAFKNISINDDHHEQLGHGILVHN